MNKITTVNGVLVAAQSDFAGHTEDKTIHLTEEERTAWNAKADASALSGKVDTGTFTAHETNPTVHVTQEEREKWNARTTKGVVAATQDGLDEHTENTTVHITEEERTAWNAKLNGPRYFERTLTKEAELLPEGEVWQNGDCFYVEMKPGDWGNSSNQISLTSFLSSLLKSAYNGLVIRLVFFNNTGKPVFLYGGAGDIEAPWDDAVCRINDSCYKVVTGVVCQGNVYCNFTTDLLH